MGHTRAFSKGERLAPPDTYSGTYKDTYGTYKDTYGTYRDTYGTYKDTYGTYRDTYGTYSTFRYILYFQTHMWGLGLNPKAAV